MRKAHWIRVVSWFMMACSLLLASCAMTSTSSSLTASQAAQINKAGNLLAKHTTVTYAQLDFIGGNTTHITFFKNDAGEATYVEDDNGYAAYCTDLFGFVRENGESAYHIDCGGDTSVSGYLLMAQGSEFVSCVILGNGTILGEMTADIDASYAAALSSWSVTTKDKMLTTVVFASDDYRVLSLDFTILHADGTKLKIASGVLLYDKPVQYPDAVSAWYLAKEKVAVTVTYPDGTKGKALIPKGERFTWNCAEGYALYLDANGTNPVGETSEAVSSDLAVYCLQKK